MKELRNDVDKELLFSNLEYAKKWYMPDIEEFPEEKEYAQEIEEANSLDELADVLNKYTDIFSDGRHHSVHEI